jgi:antitoxin VapB
MPLSIKNPQAEKPARQLAAESDESITQVIIRALEERLERVRGCRTADDLLQDIISISERCRALPDPDARSPNEISGYNSACISVTAAHTPRQNTAENVFFSKATIFQEQI